MKWVLLACVVWMGFLVYYRFRTAPRRRMHHLNGVGYCEKIAQTPDFVVIKTADGRGLSLPLKEWDKCSRPVSDNEYKLNKQFFT